MDATWRDARAFAGVSSGMRVQLAAVIAAAVLMGHVTDMTTGQPLVGVTLSAGSATAKTDARGAFVLRGLAPKTYDITLQSDDVPVVHRHVRIDRGPNRHDFTACSTTLDYGCNRNVLPGGSGAG